MDIADVMLLRGLKLSVMLLAFSGCVRQDTRGFEPTDYRRSTTTAAARSGACAQAGERVLAANATAEVVGRVAGKGEYIDVFGCLTGDTTRRSFDTCSCEYVVHSLKLRGSRALFQQEAFLGEDYSQDLVSVDVRDGTATLIEGRSLRGKQFGKFGSSRRGVVAYLVRTHGRWTVAACSGACRTAAAEPRTVSAARGIDPDYLRIRGERVYWRQRTVVRSASIAP